ncbi:MAG: hypothetical protein ACE1ZE_07525 [Candidatus Binatia bacterium]
MLSVKGRGRIAVRRQLSADQAGETTDYEQQDYETKGAKRKTVGRGQTMRIED